MSFLLLKDKILYIIFNKGAPIILLVLLKPLIKLIIQSLVLLHWLMFNASLSDSHISCTIILLILPICVLAGLMSLHSGLVLKLLLWSFIVIKQFLVLYFSTLSSIPRCPWCSRYRRRNWTWRHEFKSWTRLIAFHIALIPLGKVWIQLFSLQLWVNSRTD